MICGRRGGKSLMLALIAVYLAALRDWRPYLGPGERANHGHRRRSQARVIMRCCKGLLQSVPMLCPSSKAIGRKPSTSRTASPLKFTLALIGRRWATPSSPHCWTRSRSGRRITRPTPTLRSSMPCVLGWRQFPARCCCAPRRPTPGAGRCGTPTIGICSPTASTLVQALPSMAARPSQVSSKMLLLRGYRAGTTSLSYRLRTVINEARPSGQPSVHSHVSCEKARKARPFTPVRELIWGIPAQWSGEYHEHDATVRNPHRHA